jgi:hypothetical protein
LITRLLIGQLPEWARRDHPVLRYELGETARPALRRRLARALVVVIGGALFLIVGYVIATGTLTRPAGQTIVESINNVLYFPLIALQVILELAAFVMTSDYIGGQIRRQNWDNLRATAQGARLAMRARWLSVFYRLGGLIGVIVAARVVLIALILWDLTAFQGRYLDLLINGIVPEVPLVGAILLQSFLMTAALLLPLTSVGFGAALGLLVSAYVNGRTYATLIQFVALLVRVVLTAGLLLVADRALSGAQLGVTDVGAWFLMGGLGTLGDWGLAFLHLGQFSEVWATVPYGIFLGLGMLIFALAQAALADRVLALAVSRAQRE